MIKVKSFQHNLLSDYKRHNLPQLLTVVFALFCTLVGKNLKVNVEKKQTLVIWHKISNN